MPRAEAFAILRALQLSCRDVVLATDAAYVERRFGSLKVSKGLGCSNPDVWISVKEATAYGSVQLCKVKPHVSFEDFTAQFPDEPRWRWIANDQADKLCQAHAAKHAQRARAEVVAWVDARVEAVASHLTDAAQRSGPAVPTKQQFLQHLAETHPRHVWEVKDAVGSCVNCRLLLRNTMPFVDRLRSCAAMPCLGAGSAGVLLGHPSHGLRQDLRSWVYFALPGKRARTVSVPVKFREPCPGPKQRVVR